MTDIDEMWDIVLCRPVPHRSRQSSDLPRVQEVGLRGGRSSAWSPRLPFFAYNWARFIVLHTRSLSDTSRICRRPFFLYGRAWRPLPSIRWIHGHGCSCGSQSQCDNWRQTTFKSRRSTVVKSSRRHAAQEFYAPNLWLIDNFISSDWPMQQFICWDAIAVTHFEPGTSIDISNDSGGGRAAVVVVCHWYRQVHENLRGLTERVFCLDSGASGVETSLQLKLELRKMAEN